MMSDSYEHGRLIRAIDELKDGEQYWFDRAMKAEARIAELEAGIRHRNEQYKTLFALDLIKDKEIEQYEQSLKHLWQWLPLMYRHDYLKDYPAEKEILQGNRIRGSDE